MRYILVGLKLKSFQQFNNDFSQLKRADSGVSDGRESVARQSVTENAMTKEEKRYYRLIKQQFSEDGAVKINR
jgi:hypothetical protein